MSEIVCDHAVLLGLMGAGKSTVGAALSQRLGWPVHDSDAAIEAETGRTVAEVDAALGTDAMHLLEADHLLRQLRTRGPSIICAAASVIDDMACRAALRASGVVSVWLRAELPTLKARFASNHHRPTFGADPADLLASQIVLRHSRYRSVNPVIVDVDGYTPVTIAEMVIRKLSAA